MSFAQWQRVRQLTLKNYTVTEIAVINCVQIKFNLQTCIIILAKCWRMLNKEMLISNLVSCYAAQGACIMQINVFKLLCLW